MKKFIAPQIDLKRKVEAELFVLKKGETFGDIEFMKKIPRIFSIKCITEFGEIYILKREVAII